MLNGIQVISQVTMLKTSFRYVFLFLQQDQTGMSWSNSVNTNHFAPNFLSNVNTNTNLQFPISGGGMAGDSVNLEGTWNMSMSGADTLKTAKSRKIRRLFGIATDKIETISCENEDGLVWHIGKSEKFDNVEPDYEITFDLDEQIESVTPFYDGLKLVKLQVKTNKQTHSIKSDKDGEAKDAFLVPMGHILVNFKVKYENEDEYIKKIEIICEANSPVNFMQI
eukprot:NODE_797_length_3840_cov_0.211708.p3 type:complete len:223 gc:universal NODE_797_length_3840_cov_0.211708:1742-1074(-)